MNLVEVKSRDTGSYEQRYEYEVSIKNKLLHRLREYYLPKATLL